MLNSNEIWKLPIAWVYSIIIWNILICNRDKVFSLDQSLMHYRILRCLFFTSLGFLLLTYLIIVHSDNTGTYSYKYRVYWAIYYFIVPIAISVLIFFFLSIYYKELGVLFYTWSASIWFLCWLRIDHLKDAFIKKAIDTKIPKSAD